MHYIAVVDKDENSAFGAWFPDVPGCFSAADEHADLVRNAIEALELHLEGDELPQSRDILALREQPEVREALAKGAFLVEVPFAPPAHRPVRLNVSLDQGLVHMIDSVAKKRGMTRSAFLGRAARHEIERGH